MLHSSTRVTAPIILSGAAATAVSAAIVLVTAKQTLDIGWALGSVADVALGGMNMNKEKFKSLFCRALVIAAEKAESRAKIIVPRTFMIDLQAFGYSGGLLTCAQIINRIYIGEDKFYRIIDVAITGIHPKYAVAFARVSGHSPSVFSDTLSPNELAPFNIMTSTKIDKYE